MADIVGDRDYISRAELARFIVDQFILFTNVRIILFRQIVSTGSPGLFVSGHACKLVVKPRMEAR